MKRSPQTPEGLRLPFGGQLRCCSPPSPAPPQSRRQPPPGEPHLCRRGSAPGRAHRAMLCTHSRWMGLPQTSSTSVWDQAGHSWVLRGSMVRSNPSLPVPQCQGAPAIQRSQASCNSSGVNGSTQLRGWGPQRAGRPFVTQRDGALKPVLVLRRWRGGSAGDGVPLELLALRLLSWSRRFAALEELSRRGCGAHPSPGKGISVFR